jgi:hypothetical protein
MAIGIPESEWQYKCLAEGHSLDEDVWCYSCCESVNESPRIPPNPYASHADCHALVVWLAADRIRWQKFLHFAEPLADSGKHFMPDERLRRMMTADPAIITEAAWRTINAAEQPKAS